MWKYKNDDEVKNAINNCYKIYNEYEWLMNSYVLDFYSEKLWEKLLNSWKLFLDDLKLENLGEFLNYENDFKGTQVLPLSLLTLRNLLKNYCLPRNQININEFYIQTSVTSETILLVNKLVNNTKLNKLFWKNIKLKKQHEIELMAKICYNVAKQCDCNYIIDVGSGLGHLSRMLAYGYGFQVCSIEVQPQLSEQAIYLDKQFEKIAVKYLDNNEISYTRPIHINMKIDQNITSEDILKLVKKVFNINKNIFNIGIVGLHPCGDLGSTLLKLYNNCHNIAFINIVGCCYMKLTTTISSNISNGYPLSFYCIQKNYFLTYSSKEVACHAIENYIKKLNSHNDDELKIHAYRAVIEKIIINSWPHMKHLSLNNVKCNENLTFQEYCKKALKKLEIEINPCVIQNAEIQDNLKNWRKVVKFYVLRLMLAPLIETVILLDRFLFVRESGSKCDIIPAFNPLLSPRNHVLVALKTKNIYNKKENI